MHGSTLVIFDTEYTSWEGALDRGWSRPGEHREIVQIGAVRINEEYEVCGELELVVRPKVNPLLSDYFVELTGVTQERVDREGISFPDGFRRFLDFVNAGSGLAYSNGSDDDVLLENLRLNQREEGLPAGMFWDIQPWVRKVLDWRGEYIASNELLSVLGEDSCEAAHDALGDARTIAAAVKRLRQASQLLLPHQQSEQSS